MESARSLVRMYVCSVEYSDSMGRSARGVHGAIGGRGRLQESS